MCHIHYLDFTCHGKADQTRQAMQPSPGKLSLLPSALCKMSFAVMLCYQRAKVGNHSQHGSAELL